MGMNHLSLLETDEKHTPILSIQELIKEYFQKNKGVVKYAFFTTYDGMDITALEDLLFFVPDGNQLINQGKYDVYCGAKSEILGAEESYLSELLLEHVHRVYVENAFHPKIYMFYYLPEGAFDEKELDIFLIISSKNITKSGYLDAYACFHGVKAETVEKTNGAQLKEIITANSFLGTQENANYIAGKLKDLDHFHFLSLDKNATVSFHRPNRELLSQILNHENNEPKLIIVSPFVTCEVKEHICLYTTKETVYGLGQEPKGSLHYLNSERLEGLPSLHAKIYIKHRLDTECTEVWMGSANYTKSAFSDQNSEILVCLSYKDEGQKFYRELADSFRQEIRNEPIWKETTEWGNETSDNATNVFIPVCVYSELERLLVVKPQRKQDEPAKWEHLFAKIEEMPGVKILKIKPETSLPTRNGNVLFEYQNECGVTKGSFAFDLVSKIENDTIRAEYTNALSEYAKSECQKRNEKMLMHQSLSGIRKTSPDKHSESKTAGKVLFGRKLTLFDVVLKKKMNVEVAEIKKYLLEYKNSYIGDLPEDEAKLIEIFTEEEAHG